MPVWTVKGARRDDGQELSYEVEAETEVGARQRANDDGVLVESVNPRNTQNTTRGTSPANVSRYVLGITLVAAVAAGFWAFTAQSGSTGTKPSAEAPSSEVSPALLLGFLDDSPMAKELRKIGKTDSSGTLSVEDAKSVVTKVLGSEWVIVSGRVESLSMGSSGARVRLVDDAFKGVSAEISTMLSVDDETAKRINQSRGDARLSFVGKLTSASAEHYSTLGWVLRISLDDAALR